MPRTCSRSSTDANGPLAPRWSTIACAVDGPMPGSASSSVAVARFRSTGPGGGRAPRHGDRRRHGLADRRDVDALTVAQRGGQVQRIDVGVRRRAPGDADRVTRRARRPGARTRRAPRPHPRRGPRPRRRWSSAATARRRPPSTSATDGCGWRRVGQPGLRRRGRRAQQPPPAGDDHRHREHGGDDPAHPEPHHPRLDAIVQPTDDGVARDAGGRAARARRIPSRAAGRTGRSRRARRLLVSSARGAPVTRGMSVPATLPAGCAPDTGTAGSTAGAAAGRRRRGRNGAGYLPGVGPDHVRNGTRHGSRPDRRQNSWAVSLRR